MQRVNWLSLHHKHAENMILKDLHTYIILFKDMFKQEKRKKKSLVIKKRKSPLW